MAQPGQRRPLGVAAGRATAARDLPFAPTRRSPPIPGGLGHRPRRPAPPVAPANPAGWFPDPVGGHDHRYWDGTRWTEHVADAGVSAVDPLAGLIRGPSPGSGRRAEAGGEHLHDPVVDLRHLLRAAA